MMRFSHLSVKTITACFTAFEQKNDSNAPSKYSLGQGAKSQPASAERQVGSFRRRFTCETPALGGLQDFAAPSKVVFSGDTV